MFKDHSNIAIAINGPFFLLMSILAFSWGERLWALFALSGGAGLCIYSFSGFIARRKTSEYSRPIELFMKHSKNAIYVTFSIMVITLVFIFVLQLANRANLQTP